MTGYPPVEETGKWQVNKYTIPLICVSLIFEQIVYFMALFFQIGAREGRQRMAREVQPTYSKHLEEEGASYLESRRGYCNHEVGTFAICVFFKTRLLCSFSLSITIYILQSIHISSTCVCFRDDRLCSFADCWFLESALIAWTGITKFIISRMAKLRSRSRRRRERTPLTSQINNYSFAKFSLTFHKYGKRN